MEEKLLKELRSCIMNIEQYLKENKSVLLNSHAIFLRRSPTGREVLAELREQSRQEVLEQMRKRKAAKNQEQPLEIKSQQEKPEKEKESKEAEEAISGEEITYTDKELTGWELKELRELAAKMGINGYAKKRKSTLIKALAK